MPVLQDSIKLVPSTSPSDKWWRLLITATMAKASSSFRAIGIKFYIVLSDAKTFEYISVSSSRGSHLKHSVPMSCHFQVKENRQLVSRYKTYVDTTSISFHMMTVGVLLQNCLNPAHWPTSDINHVPSPSLISYIIVDMNFMALTKLTAFTLQVDCMKLIIL